MDDSRISESSAWYEQRATACEAESRRQIVYICAIAIFGLFAIVGLNNLISAFENAFFDTRPPNAALDRANEAIGRIDDLSDSARRNAEANAKRLTRLEVDLEARRKGFEDYREQILSNTELDLREVIWRRGVMAAGDYDSIHLSSAGARGADFFVAFGDDAVDVEDRLNLDHDLVLVHSFDGDVWHRSSFEGEPAGIAVADLHVAENGVIFAGGRRRTAGDVGPFLIRSRTGRDWTEVELGLPPGFGGIRQVATLSDGTLMLSIDKGGKSTLVRETDGAFSEIAAAASGDDRLEDVILNLHVDKDDVALTFRRTLDRDNLENYLIEAFEVNGSRSVEHRTVNEREIDYSGAFVKDADKVTFLGGGSAMDLDEPFVLRRRDNGTWEETKVAGLPRTGCGEMGFTGQQARLGQTWLIAANFCWTNDTVLATSDWQNWRRLGIPGDETSIFDHVEALVSNEDGQTLLLNQGVPYRLLSAGEAYEVLETAFAPDAAFGTMDHHSVGIAREILANVVNYKASIRLLEDEIAALKVTEATYREQAEKQSQVAELMGGVGAELRDALVEVDPVRQAVSFGSRLAFIGLLVFLIQIFVNRYRYLQRLSVFYSSRARALDLFLQLQRDAGPENSVSLDSVFGVLSADGIGFGPAPSAQFMSAPFGVQDLKKGLL